MNRDIKREKSHFSDLSMLNGMHNPETQAKRKTVPLPDIWVVEHPSLIFPTICEKIPSSHPSTFSFPDASPTHPASPSLRELTAPPGQKISLHPSSSLDPSSSMTSLFPLPHHVFYKSCL